jgi:hypothetical protein
VKSIKELKVEARTMASRRGHMLSTFTVIDGNPVAVCRRCQRNGTIHNNTEQFFTGEVFEAICG